MLDKSIEKIMRSAFAPELPYGFAERVARNAMHVEERAGIWEMLLRMTPRTSLAVGVVAVALLVVGFTGDGPSVLDSVTNYQAYSSFLSLP